MTTKLFSAPPGDLSEPDLPLWREVVASVLAAVDSGAPVAKMLQPIQTVNNGDGGGGRGVVVLGRRGQLQPAEKAAIENRAAAGDEETDDISRHRHAVVGRDQRQPGHQGIGGKWGQWQEDQSLGEMLKELREGSQKYEDYGGGGTIGARYIGPVNLL